YYTRVRNLQKAAQVIIEKHDGKFPRDFDDILALPGIGRYTAGAICSIAFNQPTPILDGNVIRVLTRVFGIVENPKEKKTNARLWKLAEDLVFYAKTFRWGETTDEPAREDARPTNQSCSHLNQSLMELGALVCTPRNAQCEICPIKKLCVAFKEKRVEELPNLGKRETATARRFMAFIVENKGRFLVRQRPAGVVNAHLWEFPNIEIINGKSGAKLAAKDILGVVPVQIEPISTVKHSITRYRITLEAFYVRLKNPPPKSAGIWLTPGQINLLAFSSAHKKLASFASNRILSGR
ncbi:MAG TPA: NUDIX domain-containing protein, partial [Candidatus Baltobacteraceae bacterium]|nr:NUDIX domain-containing protein [Candidatus Baltobacteraceae bacterium]